MDGSAPVELATVVRCEELVGDLAGLLSSGLLAARDGLADGRVTPLEVCRALVANRDQLHGYTLRVTNPRANSRQHTVCTVQSSGEAAALREGIVSVRPGRRICRTPPPRAIRRLACELPAP